MVTKITVLKARTGAVGTYRAITDEHGESYLCYDKTLWHHLEPGNYFYAEFDVTAKKDGTGSYNRIISISTEEPKAQAEPARDAAREAAAEVVGTQKTPTPIGDAKNRAFALSYAKDLAVAAQSTIGKELSSDNIIALAKKFAKYLDTGE